MSNPSRSRLQFLSADLFGLSRFARQSLSQKGRAPEQGAPILPSDLGDIPFPRDRFLPDERQELSEKIEAQLTSIGSHIAVLESVRSLQEEGACVVICEARPDLLGGPLSTIYRALTTVRLARTLTERWGRPVVPILWNLADDVAASPSVRVITPHLDLRTLLLPGVPSARVPYSEISVDQDEHRLISLTEVLRDMLAADMHSNESLTRFVPRHGESLARAWTRAMGSLLGHLGLVVLEPSWLRADLSRALALVVAPDPLDALEESRATMEAAGFELGSPREELAAVEHLRDGEHHTLRFGGEGYRFDGEPGSRTPAELAAEIVTTPEAFRPGPLLRPLVQDLALPVAAHVGDLDDLTGLAQLAKLRVARDVPCPAFVQAMSCTLLDEATEETLAQVGCSLGDYLRTKGSVIEVETNDEEPNTDCAPEGLSAEIHTISKALRKELDSLRPRLNEVSSHLPQILKHASRQVRGHLQRFAEKVDRVCANNVGGSRRDQRRLASHLLPDGQAQEQVLTALQLCARYGTDWIDQLFHETDPLPSEHVVFRLGPAPKRIRNQGVENGPWEDESGSL